MKNILMIAPTPFFADRGCHVRILNSCYRLQRRGFEVTILTYPIGRNIPDCSIERISKIPGYKKLDPGFSLFKPFLDLLLLIKGFTLLIRKNYDHLYCHLHEGAFIGIILSKLFNKLFIFDCQGSLSGELKTNNEVKSLWLLKVTEKIEDWIYKQSNTIIVSNESIKTMISKSSGYEKEISVIPDYPDINVFNRNIKPIDLGIENNKYIVVYLGGLNKNKGIDYLLEAIPLTNENIYFLILGYPLEYVEKRINDLELLSRVKLLGPIKYEKAGQYLANGHIAISPKITDESGEANAKLFSYISVGLKVICFDSEENRMILENNGYFAKQGDVKDLAKQIDYSYKDYING